MVAVLPNEVPKVALLVLNAPEAKAGLIKAIVVATKKRITARKGVTLVDFSLRSLGISIIIV